MAPQQLKWAAAAAVLAAWLLANPNFIGPGLLAPRGAVHSTVEPAEPAEPERLEAPLSSHSHALNTYYLQASGARLAPAVDNPTDDLVLDLQLPVDAVSPYMPIVSATHDGLLHQLVHSASFLQVGDSFTLFAASSAAHNCAQQG